MIEKIKRHNLLTKSDVLDKLDELIDVVNRHIEDQEEFEEQIKLLLST